jgi:RNA polymerase sigma-70 factor (ECF subfamily)
MTEIGLSDGLRRSLVHAWHEYAKSLDPLRPDLFRFCRRLTGDVWDAEDLVQETLARGFASFSQVVYPLERPRAYLLRIATNLWTDTVRRRAVERRLLEREAREAAPGTGRVDESELRAAVERLLEALAPRERAAVLLKEVFGMTNAEAAEALGTSEGAVKSALHRGRERLAEAREAPRALRAKPAREVVERFVALYNARDLAGLLALLGDGATIELYGSHHEVGRTAWSRERGWFYHNFHAFDGTPSKLRCELATFAGEPLMLVFDGEQKMVSVMRLEAGDGRVERVRVYAMCPDVVREVGEALGQKLAPPFGYRFPFDLSRTL